MLLKETLKEINQLKSNYSANSSIYTLLKGHRLLLLVRNDYGYSHGHGHAWAPIHATPETLIHATHETTETEYAIYELINPQSYCGESHIFTCAGIPVGRYNSNRGVFPTTIYLQQTCWKTGVTGSWPAPAVGSSA